MDDFLDMLSPKEVKKIAKELEGLSEKVEKTGTLMKDALDMSGSAQALEKYASILERDVNSSFDKIFGKQQRNLSLEEKRLRLLEASAKAIRDGDKAQQESLKTLMMNLERVKQAKEKIPDSLQKAHGALSLMSGILPTSGASRALSLGQGANSLMGGGMSLGKMGMIGGGLAVAGYGASRMMGGYQTYKQQAGDVFSAYGKMGREGVGQVNLTGSTQGYSSLERAQMMNAMSTGAREGTNGFDVGRTVNRNLPTAERLSRSYGLDLGKTGGMISSVEQISGRGGSLTERMMAQAVASGVNRARISSFMEKSLHLTEQVYQATGKEDTMGINSLLASIMTNAKDKEYASRYGAQAVGQIGESIRGVGMGGGDLATQGFLSRAFARDNDGKQLNRYEFMKRAQAGAGGGNIRAVLQQADEEFKTPEQRNVAMSQMFGVNFRQAEMLSRSVSGGTLSDEDIDKQIQKMRKENFVQNSPEGDLLDKISKSTTEQAKIGREMLPLATQMISLQTSMDKGILMIASGVNGIMDFLGVSDKYEDQKQSDLEVARRSTSVSNEFEVGKKYGGAKDKKALDAYRAIEFQDDDKVASAGDIDALGGYGMSKINRISGLTKKMQSEGAYFPRKAIKEEIIPEMEKLKSFSTRLKEEQSTTKDPEVFKKIGAMIERMEKAYSETHEVLKKNSEKMELFGNFGEKSGELTESIKGVMEGIKVSTPVRNVGVSSL